MRRIFSFTMPTLLLPLVIHLLGSFLLLLSYLPIADQALAAAPITPSGLNTQVSQAVTLPTGQTEFNITGGTRPGGVSGTNLFHSFGDFNVPNNNIANFLNDSGLATSNILGRVTGGNISNIFGTIQTTGFGSANFFLMNPTGFLFGPNATVNVGGMVAFTSADYLRLANGVLFNAIPNATADALLSASPVAAFGFLGSNPGAITVQGSQLSVADGTGISLVGGNITIQSGTLDNGTVQPARLYAPNGQINLATAASPGEFLLQDLQAGGVQAFQITPTSLASLAGPNINSASFTSFASVHLAPGSTVDVSQTGNGKVSIRGGQFAVDIQNASLSTASSAAPATAGQDNVLISAGSSIISDTSSVDRGPDVQIVADSIKMAGTPPGPGPPNFAFIHTTTTASGDAGNISLTTTQSLEFTASVIRTNSLPSSETAATPSGDTGNISLTSTEGNISLTSITQVGPQSINSTGNAGSITVNAPHGDIILDSAALFSSLLGPPGFIGASGGGIQITANNLTLRHSSAPPAGIAIDNFSPQVPGNITVALSGNLSLDGKSFIETVARGPAFAAADLNITAHDVSVTGGSYLNTQTISSGRGGQLNIFADSVRLTNGGKLLSGSVSGADIFTGKPTNPSGPAGTINVKGPSGAAASVLIDGVGSGIFTNSVGTGAAGNTNITAQSVTIQNGGTLSAATSGTAPTATGGTILVKADTVTLNTGGTMTAASTGPGASGEVVVQGLASPAQSILIDGAGSGIFTDTHSTGAGGNISVNANSVTLQNGGTLSAATSGTAASAKGGTIKVETTDHITMTGGASITASSKGPANAGNISIKAGQQFEMRDSSITTTATKASGGNIDIQAVDRVRLVNSPISTTVHSGAGGGGNITIDPNVVVLLSSPITAQADRGAGGNITITTPLFLSDFSSPVKASSERGVNGTVTIQSPNAPASGHIQPLANSPLQATPLLNQRCASLAGGEFSSFTVAGRDSLPTEPGSWLASPLATLSAGTELGAKGEVESSVARSEGLEGMTLGASLAGDRTLLSLRQIAPAGFLAQAFAVDWSAGCQS